MGRRRLPTRLTSQCSCSNQSGPSNPLLLTNALEPPFLDQPGNDLHGESVTPGLIRTPSSRWRRLYATTTDLVSRLTDRPIRPSSILTETSWSPVASSDFAQTQPVSAASVFASPLGGLQ